MDPKDSDNLKNHKRREDLDSVTTDLKGYKGVFELLLRRFRGLLHLAMMLPLYMVGSACLGLAATPGVMFFSWAHRFSAHWGPFLKYPWLGFSLAASYFIYGLTLITVIPLLNRLTVGSLKAWRGPYYSAASFKWYLHNAFTYLVRYTFLEFVTPSPLNIFYFRQMGMKIGYGTQINSAHISDPSLISIGNKVTIGGSATIVAHYGAGGFLVIAPTIIGDKATIGLRATIMGGVEIGNNAKVLPNSVVLPKTKIPDGEIWGGVPAVPLDKKSLTHLRNSA
ncbi:MAG: acyltransferase [Pseudobdellovibrionaceae bacterium]|nr:acyltransferase [Bdellovibrionales bacterium]USN48802.1 MAG: acyltransferase [Pseudobdellovibrionaceae bacterium]